MVLEIKLHYARTPVCAPARCMMTGRRGGQEHIRGNYGPGGLEDDGEGELVPLPGRIFTEVGIYKCANN